MSLLLGVALSPTLGAAQDMPVPMGTQVFLFARIWEYDRAHPARLDDQLVVGIAYQSRYRMSLLAREEFEAELQSLLGPLLGDGLRIVALEVSEPGLLASDMAEAGVDVLYVTPLRAIDLAEIARVTRGAQVLSITGVPEYVVSGLAVGLDDQGGTPDILVNLESARGEGARFGSQLLKLATLVAREEEQ